MCQRCHWLWGSFFQCRSWSFHDGVKLLDLTECGQSLPQLGIIKKGHKFGSKLVTFTKGNKCKLANFRKVTSLGSNLWTLGSKLWPLPKLWSFQTCDLYDGHKFGPKGHRFGPKVVTFKKVTKVTSLDQNLWLFIIIPKYPSLEQVDFLVWNLFKNMDCSWCAAIHEYYSKCNLN